MRRSDPSGWPELHTEHAQNDFRTDAVASPAADYPACTDWPLSSRGAAPPAVSPLPPSLIGSGKIGQLIVAFVLGIAGMGTAQAQWGFGMFGGSFPGGPAFIGDDLAVNYDPNLPGYCIGSGGFGPCQPQGRPPASNPPSTYRPPVQPAQNEPREKWCPGVGYRPINAACPAPPSGPSPYVPPAQNEEREKWCPGVGIRPFNSICPPQPVAPAQSSGGAGPPTYATPGPTGTVTPPQVAQPGTFQTQICPDGSVFSADVACPAGVTYRPPVTTTPSGPQPAVKWCPAEGMSVLLADYSFARCELQRDSSSGARVVTGDQPADGKSQHILEVATRNANGLLVGRAAVLFSANPALSFNGGKRGEEGGCITDYSTGMCRVTVTSTVEGLVSTGIKLVGLPDEISGEFTLGGVRYGRSPLTYRFGSPAKMLELVKLVRNVTQNGGFGVSNSAKPGDVLEYRVTYSNNLSHAVSGLEIADVTPSFTSFISAHAQNTPAGLTRCEKRTPLNPAPTAKVACAVEQTAASGKLGEIAFTFDGTIQPADSGSILFRVKVD